MTNTSNKTDNNDTKSVVSNDDSQQPKVKVEWSPENEKILDDRQKLKDLSLKKFTTDAEKQWLRQKLLEYKVKRSDRRS